MMSKAEPRENVEFYCDDCTHRWQAKPASYSQYEDRFHPFTYLGECPECGAESRESDRYRNRLKAWACATGPKTAEGKQKSAKNLAGYPTPEQTKRTRFNALKTGVHAEVATHFPAVPGKYPDCEGCEFRHGRCIDQEAAQGPCLKKTELFMQHWQAFDQRDPVALKTVMTRIQFFATTLIESMFAEIVRKGVMIETPKWYVDKNDNVHLVEYKDDHGTKQVVKEINANPLLRTFTELLHRNNMTLHDAGMTMLQAEQEQKLPGYLSDENSQESIADYQQDNAKKLEGLRQLLQNSQDSTKRDPVLIEHGNDNG